MRRRDYKRVLLRDECIPIRCERWPDSKGELDEKRTRNKVYRDLKGEISELID